MSEPFCEEIAEAERLMSEGNYEEALNLINKYEKETNLINEKKISCLILKVEILYLLGKIDEALELGKQAENLLKSLDEKTSANLIKKEMNLVYSASLIHLYRGELDESLKYCFRSLEFNDLQKLTKINVLNNIGEIYRIKGNLKEALDYSKQSLELSKKINNKPHIAELLWRVGEIHRMGGNLDAAIKHMEESLSLSDEVNEKNNIVNALFHMVRAYVDMNNLKQAEKYLKRLEEINDKNDNLLFSQLFRVAKAYLLKTSLRAYNRVEAEKILREVVEEEIAYHSLTIIALIYLCDLMLTELRITNEIKIIEEINPLISRLFQIAEEQHSYRWLVETKLLQAKLALIQIKTEKAARFLTEAQKLADEHGLKQLAKRISNEHDILLEQLDIWENVGEETLTMAERLKLASVSGIINRMIGKNALDTKELKTEQPILLAILSDDRNKILFSHEFIPDIHISLSQIIQISKLFSDSIDRVKILDYTMLLQSVNLSSVCYIFIGQSYSAQQKLIQFSEIIEKRDDILTILKNIEDSNKNTIINGNPILEELITEIFLSDSKYFSPPFKAYAGDEPFVFVSYAHIDKLQVYPILEFLNNVGINIWYDEAISASENWLKKVTGFLNKCAVFIVFLSNNSVTSEEVLNEVDYIFQRFKKKEVQFIPIYLKETILPDELRLAIGRIQAMKKHLMPEAEFLKQLKDLLKRPT
ncbi:MAG: tetratricopeptide repeat protein [Promethearchaeota archaeon]